VDGTSAQLVQANADFILARLANFSCLFMHSGFATQAARCQATVCAMPVAYRSISWLCLLRSCTT
jgi:hypothetical protein